MYCQARHSLHTQLTDLVVGRDEEIESLTNIIEPALRNKTSESLYISGELAVELCLLCAILQFLYSIEWIHVRASLIHA